MNVSFNPASITFLDSKESSRYPANLDRVGFAPPAAAAERSPKLAAFWRIDPVTALLTCEWSLVGGAGSALLIA